MPSFKRRILNSRQRTAAYDDTAATPNTGPSFTGMPSDSTLDDPPTPTHTHTHTHTLTVSIKCWAVSGGEHQIAFLSFEITEVNTRLQSESIIWRKKGLLGDNEDVNWASPTLIKENEFCTLQLRFLSLSLPLPLSLSSRLRCTSCTPQTHSSTYYQAAHYSQTAHEHDSSPGTEGLL